MIGRSTPSFVLGVEIIFRRRFASRGFADRIIFPRLESDRSFRCNGTVLPGNLLAMYIGPRFPTETLCVSYVAYPPSLSAKFFALWPSECEGRFLQTVYLR